jgi:hypothetical protein
MRFCLSCWTLLQPLLHQTLLLPVHKLRPKQQQQQQQALVC